jgi:hypothetical protein
MKAYWGVDVQLHEFLTSALDGDKWSVGRTQLLYPRNRTSRSHWIGGWVALRASLDAVVKRKILNPSRESNPGHLARGLIAIPTELSRLISETCIHKQIKLEACYHSVQSVNFRASCLKT